MDDELLNTLLQKTGKARFVDWLEFCDEELTISQTIAKIRSIKEYGYTSKSYETRVHNIRTIKKADRANDALLIALNSKKLEPKIKEKAFELIEKDIAQKEPYLPQSTTALISQIDETDKLTNVKARIGQDKFRQALVKKWRGCSVTGYKDCSLLIASHIKPWRLSNSTERLDPENGLLLLPNLDKLFDRRLISFNHKGNIMVSPQLVSPSTFNVSNNMKIYMTAKCAEYMDFHRTELFKA
ncbi:HNH endonuclease [Kordiimonas sp. SCSIO 12603]|uniref:HNH endonuclease n=1 Tax=Kordiimonas sp. SCSIO 12603 TaxID=2829596 RepID=UPI0021037854|nr:HNH endonuclease signature motif containing protein [Kordiimonas sp. SCSIO 12603]UTW59293.1 HNH endonuclease [Kordiimonas sp. SCSIO 12603]